MEPENAILLRYEPLFPYFQDRGKGSDSFKPNFVVIADPYVTDDAGIVHFF